MSGKKRSRSGPETAPGERRSVSRHSALTFCRATYAMPMHSPTMPAPGFCEEKNSKMAGPTQRMVRGRRFLAGTTDPIEKSTSVTVACRPVAALFSLASLISAMPGAPRTVGTVLRATLSSPARTRTTATRFTLNVKSSIRIPARSERTPPQECETLTLRSLALKLNFFRTLGARHIGRQLRFGALRTQDRASPIAFNKMRTRICAKSRRPNSHASIALRQGH